MLNPLTSNTERMTTARDSSLRRRKRKKMQRQSESAEMIETDKKLCKNDYQITQWKSEAQQRVYSSKLLQALRQIRFRNAQNSGAGTIRETADRVLAVTAKGRTRWSRAILTNKLKLKFMKLNRKQRGLIATSRMKKPKMKLNMNMNMKKKNLPEVQRKTRVLGGLVPGCQKQRLPVVLEEATSYIPALEMQVKAMAALVELLSGGSSSGTGDLSQLNFSRPPPWL
ncbi:hypothetical protein QVD17_40075 [Tagetes erecta]|uniref:IBH1-like N-terminal domain-containing protein n=1 Tax=Tagetes erecta TaxID=13708 RepID=A0AAD8NHN9_TARER|nr:hypothetical protein QVD17_40075 [Tagetes erecta]